MGFRSCVGEALQRVSGPYSMKMLAGGLLSCLPGQQMFGLRGTVLHPEPLPASYYYSIWLRHLVKAHDCGAPTTFDTVAELGPGDALGVGIAALLSGAQRYIALDIVDASGRAENLRVFEGIVDLLRARAPIPDRSLYPEAEPLLESYDFPAHVLSEKRLVASLAADRLAAIRCAVASAGHHQATAGPISITYVVPWSDARAIRHASVDLILSQAVLEHVDDLAASYQAMAGWLKPGGLMSHAIDFRAHGTSRYANGHWAYGRVLWTLVRGRRPFLLNRQPHSKHLALMGAAGFRIVRDEPVIEEPALPRGALAQPFRGLSESDLKTSRAFVQAIKAR